MRLRSFSLLALLPVLLSPLAAQAQAADPQVARGQRLFMRCIACHDITESKLVKIGPNLKGVIGRAAGSMAGANYSAAMKKQSFTWDAAKLDAWLTRPGAVVPGTSMVFEGLPAEADRKAVIAYLAAQR